jgi:hypothetical protein
VFLRSVRLISPISSFAFAVVFQNHEPIDGDGAVDLPEFFGPIIT